MLNFKEKRYVEITSSEQCPYRGLVCNRNGVFAYYICKKLSTDDVLRVCKTDCFIEDCPLLKKV